MKVCDYFFLNDPATPEIYTLPLHDALPISTAAAGPPAAYRRPRRGGCRSGSRSHGRQAEPPATAGSTTTWSPSLSSASRPPIDRKSTRLNSSHVNISYAVFCLKKKITYTLYRMHALTAPSLTLITSSFESSQSLPIRP